MTKQENNEDDKVLDFAKVKREWEIGRRSKMMQAIEDLQVEHMDVLDQLIEYSRNCQHRVNAHAEKVLIERGILNKDGSLPEITNEAMYIWRRGEKPFWVDSSLWDIW